MLILVLHDVPHTGQRFRKGALCMPGAGNTGHIVVGSGVMDPVCLSLFKVCHLSYFLSCSLQCHKLFFRYHSEHQDLSRIVSSFKHFFGDCYSFTLFTTLFATLFTTLFSLEDRLVIVQDGFLAGFVFETLLFVLADDLQVVIGALDVRVFFRDRKSVV